MNLFEEKIKKVEKEQNILFAILIFLLCLRLIIDILRLSNVHTNYYAEKNKNEITTINLIKKEE